MRPGAQCAPSWPPAPDNGQLEIMRPTADLVSLAEIRLAVVGWRSLGWRREQQVVDALGVGLDVAGEAAEQLADRRRGLAWQVLEEDVIGVGDLDQEVSASAAAARLVAALDRLDQNPGGVGGDTEGRAHRLVAHRLDHARAEGGADLLGPATHGAAVEAQTEPDEAVLLAM